MTANKCCWLIFSADSNTSNYSTRKTFINRNEKIEKISAFLRTRMINRPINSLVNTINFYSIVAIGKMRLCITICPEVEMGRANINKIKNSNKIINWLREKTGTLK